MDLSPQENTLLEAFRRLPPNAADLLSSPEDLQLLRLAVGFASKLKLTIPDGVDSLRFYVTVKHLENSGAAA